MTPTAPKRGGGRTRKAKASAGRRGGQRRTTGTKRPTKRTATTRSNATSRRAPMGRGLQERNRGIQRSNPSNREEGEMTVGTRRGRSERGSERQVGRRAQGDEDLRQREGVVREPGIPRPDKPAEGLEDEE